MNCIICNKPLSKLSGGALEFYHCGEQWQYSEFEHSNYSDGKFRHNQIRFDGFRIYFIKYYYYNAPSRMESRIYKNEDIIYESEHEMFDFSSFDSVRRSMDMVLTFQ